MNLASNKTDQKLGFSSIKFTFVSTETLFFRSNCVDWTSNQIPQASDESITLKKVILFLFLCADLRWSSLRFCREWKRDLMKLKIGFSPTLTLHFARLWHGRQLKWHWNQSSTFELMRHQSLPFNFDSCDALRCNFICDILLRRMIDTLILFAVRSFHRHLQSTWVESMTCGFLVDAFSFAGRNKKKL